MEWWQAILGSGGLAAVITLVVAPVVARRTAAVTVRAAEVAAAATREHALATEKFKARFDFLMHPVDEFRQFAGHLDDILSTGITGIGPGRIEALRFRIGNAVYRTAQFEDRTNIHRVVSLFDKARQDLSAAFERTGGLEDKDRWNDETFVDSWRRCFTYLNALHHLVTWAAERRIEEMDKGPDENLPARFAKIAEERVEIRPPS